MVLLFSSLWVTHPAGMGFDYRPFRGLGETEAPVLRRHKQNFACTKTQRKGTVNPQETEPKLPVSVGGPPVEAWVGRDSPQGHWQQQARKVLLGISSLDTRAGSPQAKQLPGRECNPTHQQII